MNLAGSSILFMLFITAYTIMIEIFTVLFRLTGLTNEKARMQVISMLTNSGYTTAESEIIMSSRRRRQLARITMMTGYSFSVIIVSIMVNVIIAMTKSELHQLTNSVLMVVIFLIVLFTLIRMQFVQNQLDHLIEIIGNRIMFGRHSNPVILIDIYHNKAMAEVFLNHVPAMLEDQALAESNLKSKYDIQVLFIKRGGSSLNRIDGETVLKSKDRLVLFGNYKNIRTLFERI